MSLIFVDSSCDLDFQQIKNLGIECFHLPFVLNGEEGSTNSDFDYHKFYSKILSEKTVRHDTVWSQFCQINVPG